MQLNNLTRERTKVGPYVLEIGLPGKPKCPDQYTPASTIVCPGATVLTAQISKNAVYVQIGFMEKGKSQSEGDVEWQKERSWLPTSFALGRSFDAVRVRNFAAGEEGQVSIEAY